MKDITIVILLAEYISHDIAVIIWGNNRKTKKAIKETFSWGNTQTDM